MLQRNLKCFVVRLALAAATCLIATSALDAQSSANLAPRFSLEVNGVRQAQAYAGWPVILKVMLFHPQIFATAANVAPLNIIPVGGSWANNLKLSVVDANGVNQDWPAQFAKIPTGALLLDQQSTGNVAWVVSPTATIPPGTYRVVGTLDTTASAGTTGWSGRVTSNAVSIQIEASPATLTPVQEGEKLKLSALYDHLTGNDAQALTDLNDLLAKQPEAVPALAFQGDLLGQMGQTRQALHSYDQALTNFYAAQSSELTEPPVHLLVPKARLYSQLLSQSGIRGKPQISVKLVGHGVQSAGVIYLDLQFMNIGSDVAEKVKLARLSPVTLAGTGQVSVNGALSPVFPISTGFLKVGSSETIRVYLNLPATVSSYSLTETGAAADIFGTPSKFSNTESIEGNGAVIGDLNADGVVDCADLALVKASFGKQKSQPGFDPRADVNGDGVVDALDLSAVENQIPLGMSCSQGQLTTTAMLSPQPNGADWNDTDVVVTLTSASNSGSGIRQITYSAIGAQSLSQTSISGSSASLTISSEGITTISFFATDNAGNVESAKSITINMDKTPPSIVGTGIPVPNAKGWNNSAVTVAFQCSDALSGLAAGNPPTPTTISSEGAGQSVTGNCRDIAGNTASSTVQGINIDLTPPILTIASNPPTNGNGWNNSDVTVSFAAADALSGIGVVSGPVTVTTEGIGQVVSGSATDLAGNLTIGKTSVNLDKTPPEAINQFDPATEDVVLFGRDSLSGVAPGPIQPQSVVALRRGDEDDEETGDLDGDDVKAELRTYQILDLAGNPLRLVEKVRKEGRHHIRVGIVSLQYGHGPVITLPRNRQSYGWTTAKDGSLKKLDQELIVGPGKQRLRIEAEFDSRVNQTLIVQREPDPKTKVTKAGLDLLRMATSDGKLSIEF